tara:strand:+ start:316 stop:1320 length:1005 start_codon:yes stop_codon:yes gene_type:complete
MVYQLMISGFNIFIFFQIIINIIFLINFTKIASYVNIYDIPNKRKIHINPVPPIGGILFFINFIYIFCVSKISGIQVFYFDYIFIIFSSLIFILGLVDDKKNLNPYLKFLVLISLIVFHLILQNNFLINKFYLDFINFDVHLTYYQSFFFTTLCILLFINASNLYDGINLQYSLYIFIFFSYLIFKNNDLEIIKLLYLPLIFFIYLNLKSKCFLGDSGTLFISYLIAMIVIKEHNIMKNLSISEIILLMILPGIDMLRLFVKRILSKKNPFLGDRNHFHHLLFDKFGLLKTNLILISLTTFPLIFLNFFNDHFVFILLVVIAIYFCILKFYKKI